MPFVGVQLDCTWEAGHGVGILLRGDKPLEIGEADIAFELWIAKRRLRQQF